MKLGEIVVHKVPYIALFSDFSLLYVLADVLVSFACEPSFFIFLHRYYYRHDSTNAVYIFL